jgi:predicted PurR-regulated permease PerM
MALIELNDRTVETGRVEPVDRPSVDKEEGLPLPANLWRDTAPLRAMSVIAFFCAGCALWAGQKFMIPLVSGIMLAMLVAPAVALLARVIRLKLLSAVLVLLTVIAISIAAIAFFGGHITRVVDRVPDMIHAVSQQLATSGPASSNSIIGRFRDAITELERVAGEAVAQPAVESRRIRPASKLVEPPAPKLAPAVSLASDSVAVVRLTALSGSSALASVVATISITLFTAFFILIGGNDLRTKFLDLWGASPEGRVRASKALDEAARQTRIYAGVLLITNTLIGVAVFVAFLVAGLPDPGGWAVTAGLLHVVPYLGMALLTVLGGAEAYLALGSFGGALAMGGFIVAVSTVIGTLVSAWLQARSSEMNPAAVFVGLMFWGALWGIWGLLLGPALVVLMKVIAEQIPSGQRFARLLSG